MYLVNHSLNIPVISCLIIQHGIWSGIRIRWV